MATSCSGGIFSLLHKFVLSWIKNNTFITHRTGGVMVSVLASSEVDRGFEPRSGQPKDYNICIWFFSAKHAELRRKSKDWLAQNENNRPEWSDTSTCGLLFQWASTIKIQLSVLADLTIISLIINLFSPWYSWKFAELALTNNRSLTFITNICYLLVDY